MLPQHISPPISRACIWLTGGLLGWGYKYANFQMSHISLFKLLTNACDWQTSMKWEKIEGRKTFLAMIDTCGLLKFGEKFKWKKVQVNTTLQEGQEGPFIVLSYLSSAFGTLQNVTSENGFHFVIMAKTFDSSIHIIWQMVVIASSKCNFPKLIMRCMKKIIFTDLICHEPICNWLFRLTPNFKL